MQIVALYAGAALTGLAATALRPQVNAPGVRIIGNGFTVSLQPVYIAHG